MSQQIHTEEGKVFTLTDGTRLLPNLAIQGPDGVITKPNGSKWRPTLGVCPPASASPEEGSPWGLYNPT